jgi:hypothetical protein
MILNLKLRKEGKKEIKKEERRAARPWESTKSKVARLVNVRNLGYVTWIGRLVDFGWMRRAVCLSGEVYLSI